MGWGELALSDASAGTTGQIDKAHQLLDYLKIQSGPLAVRVVEVVDVVKKVRGPTDPFEDIDMSEVRVRFWTCPIPHPKKPQRITVAWEGDVAHCTWPGCEYTSANTTADNYRKRHTWEFVYAVTVEVAAEDEISALHVMEWATQWPRRQTGPGHRPAKWYESEYRGFECTACVTRTSQPEMIVLQPNGRWRMLIVVHVLGKGVDKGDAHNGVMLATEWPVDWRDQSPKVERHRTRQASIIKFTYLMSREVVHTP